MKKILEPKTLRKLDILLALTSNFEPQNMNELATELTINIKTLLSAIEEINDDAIRYQQHIKIERNSKNELRAIVANDFSLYAFKLKYLEESLAYQIIDIKFKNPNVTLNSIAEDNHISTASLYRKTVILKEIFTSFNLEFDAHHSFPIRGDEKQVRYFYYKFYGYRNQLSEWPFTEEMEELCTKIYEAVFKDYFKIKNSQMKKKCILFLAISLIRTTNGFYLNESEMLKMKNLVEENLIFLEFKARFFKKISELNLEESVLLKEEDLILILMLLACDEDFLDTIEFRSIVLMGEKRTLFEKAAMIFLDKLKNRLGFFLTADEYSQLSSNLLRILTEEYFFPEKDIFFTINYRFDYLDKYYYGEFTNSFNEFYEELFKDEAFQIFRSNKNLYPQFILLLVDNLDISHFNPEINIFMHKARSSHLDAYYRRKIKSLIHSPINFVEEDADKSEVDLIISHTVDGTSELNSFVLDAPATPWDWNRLTVELNRIQLLKKGDNTWS